LNSNEGGVPANGLDEGCEGVKLLELRGEYASFIIDLETEREILIHLMGCERCRDRVKLIVQRGEDDDRWNRLFSRDLPEVLGETQDTLDASVVLCPRVEESDDVDNFINARIRWRIKKLRELIDNAETELRDLNSQLS
jgi:hypothetical protein